MRRTSGLMVAMLALVIAACGDSTATTTTVAGPAAPATTRPLATGAPPTTMAAAALAPIELTTDAGTVELDAPAERIAVLSATHVEMLYAIGAGDRLIAGDLFSDYPPEALELTQLDSFNLSVESVIELDPDLVVLTFDPGDAVAAFTAVGIPTLLYPPAPSLEAAYEQMRALGAASGHLEDAEKAVNAIAASIAGIRQAVGDTAAGLTYYHETDPFSFYTPNSSSFIGQLYELIGMENIADAAPDEFGSGYPQLSPEFIIESDPDVVFLGGGDGATAESVSERNGWATMSAVIAGRVFVVDADESSRWGPRIVDFLSDIADAVLSLDPAEG